MQVFPRTFAAATLFLFGATFFSAESARSQSAPPEPRRFVITEFGAKGDGAVLNTQAIQSAIDKTAAAGGGTLVFPEGVFLSGAIFLKPGVNLHLEKNAVLKGSTNAQDYPKANTRIEGHFEPWLPALVNAEKTDHLRIDGEGTLDGNGKPFWDLFWSKRKENSRTTNLDVERPRLLFIQESDDVQIKGIHLKDSGFWNIHLYRCQNVVVENVNIQAPGGRQPDRAPSSDGIDIDSCQHVTVRDCYISVGDDCIALKGSKGPFAMDDKSSPPVEHILVTGCTFGLGGGVLTCGSEATIVRDVVVEHCTVNGPVPIVRLKLRPDTPQLYEDLHYRDITLNSPSGSILEVQPWRQFFDLKGQPPPKSIVRNVTVSDIKGEFGSLGVLKGNERDTITDIVLENINVTLKNDQLQLGKVENLAVKNVIVNGKPFSIPAETKAPEAKP